MKHKHSLLTLLALAAILAFCFIPTRSYAYDEEDYLEPTGNSRFDDFIHDPEHTDGVYWDIKQTPKLTNGGATGCASYCVDFSKYCYDKGALTSSDSYTDPSEIRAGDIIHLTSPGSGHWFAVLRRDGDNLYTAEGNWASYTVVSPYHYVIEGDDVLGSRHHFDVGYHFIPKDTGAKAWKETDDGWRYEDSYGFYVQNDWVRYNGKWYYFGNDGIMVTGWQKLGNKWYYFNKNGAMTTEWKRIDGKWYYFGKNGAMVKGWRRIDGTWYYFANGAMVTGWKTLSGVRYYFAGGAMTTGWKRIDKKWYFFSDEGSMYTGWLEYNGNIYYMDEDGVMVTGTVTIDEIEYTFNKNGTLNGDFYIAG